MPDTRPGLSIGADGVCSACKTHSTTKAVINWVGREQAFQDVVINAKLNSKGYDCLVPVSGGKDSTWQIVKCLEYGLNPLAVTWKTPARTQIGTDNLQNLINLGVDHIDYQISPLVEKRFMLKAFETYGSTAIPMHMAIFNIPLQLATRFDIPLIIYGENSAFEYGGQEDEVGLGFLLNQQWLQRWGVTHGTTAKDWISADLTQRDLTPYFGPTAETLAAQQTRAIFLGYYFEWDPEESLHVAQANGFKSNATGALTGYYDYADIDDEFISLHHFLKWYKFGFTRTFDNLSLEIRNGRLTRTEALDILRMQGDQTPIENINTFCEFAGITSVRFFEICETFRNTDLWQKNANKNWYLPEFLLPDWTWQ